MHVLLWYETVPDYVEKRKPYRKAHLALLKQAFDAGQLILAGALADPSDEAVLVFRGSDTEVAEAFAKSDPYVLNGLVSRWTVRKWATVVGDGVPLPILD
jgi:uncharacterized protein YciI